MTKGLAAAGGNINTTLNQLPSMNTVFKVIWGNYSQLYVRIILNKKILLKLRLREIGSRNVEFD